MTECFKRDWCSIGTADAGICGSGFGGLALRWDLGKRTRRLARRGRREPARHVLAARVHLGSEARDRRLSAPRREPGGRVNVYSAVRRFHPVLTRRRRALDACIDGPG